MRRASSALLVLALVGCDRPNPLVLCHNGNCVTPDVDADDTLAALDESLKLQFRGLPVIDGVEIDTLPAPDGRCLFAHDSDPSETELATDAGEMIGTHLADNPRASWNGERFYLFVELKMSNEDPDQHAACVLDVMDLVIAGARTGGHELTIGFSSQDPNLLDAVQAHLPERDTTGVTVLLVGDIFFPYASVAPHLADYSQLDAMEYHPDFMTEGRYQTYQSLGLDLAQWQFTMTIDAFDALERYRPRWVITNEAELTRRWIEN